MDIVASIIKALFGSKADKDRKQIEPYLEKIKAVYQIGRASCRERV